MSFEIESRSVENGVISDLKESLRFLRNSVSRLPKSTWRKHVLWNIDQALRWKQGRDSDSLESFLILVNSVKETSQEHRCSSIVAALLAVQIISDELLSLVSSDIPTEKFKCR